MRVEKKLLKVLYQFSSATLSLSLSLPQLKDHQSGVSLVTLKDNSVRPTGKRIVILRVEKSSNPVEIHSQILKLSK